MRKRGPWGGTTILCAWSVRSATDSLQLDNMQRYTWGYLCGTTHRKIWPERMNEWERAINILCMFQHDEKPYCSNCYLKMFCPRGTTFSEAHTQIYTVPPKTQRLNVFPLCVNLSQQATGDWCRPGSAQCSISDTGLGQNEQIQECKRRTKAGNEKIS